MTAVSNTPENRNFLSPLNFKFSIKRAPYINFYLQKCNIPYLTLNSINIPTVFNPIPTTASNVQYGEFSITFKVDEDLSNYLEIHNWIRYLGFPEDFNEYANLADKPTYLGEGLRAELSLMILNSAKNPNYEFTFRDAFPISLSEINFDSTANDVDFVTAEARFKYILFDVKKIS